MTAHACVTLRVGGCTCVFIKKVPVILVCGSPQLTLSPVLYSSHTAPREEGEKSATDGEASEQDKDRYVKVEEENRRLERRTAYLSSKVVVICEISENV